MISHLENLIQSIKLWQLPTLKTFLLRNATSGRAELAIKLAEIGVSAIKDKRTLSKSSQTPH